jgi:hypothetical protein
MYLRKVIFLVALSWLAPASQAYGNAFTISDWDIGVSVYSSGVGSDSAFSLVVENPFQETHTAVVGNSFATATYDFAWAGRFGAFLIQSAHEAEGVESELVVAFSSGGFYITPAEDLLLNVDAAYSYEFSSSASMVAKLTISVRYADQSVGIFGQTEQAVTFPGEPLAGTLAIQADVILPANEALVIGYRMKASNGSLTATTVTGDGHVSFTITPEPTTASLLALAGVMLLQRRRRCRCSSERDRSERTR